MGHGENAERHYGRDYWSRRLPHAFGWGKYPKKLTHRLQRKRDVEEINNQLMEADMGRNKGKPEPHNPTCHCKNKKRDVLCQCGTHCDGT